MQQPQLRPMLFPTMLPSVLVFCQISFPTLPPSVLVRWAGKGSRPWVLGAVMQAAVMQAAVVPSVLSGNATISVCEKGLQEQLALGVLAVMHQTAVMPDVISLTPPSVLVRRCRRTSLYIFTQCLR